MSCGGCDVGKLRHRITLTAATDDQDGFGEDQLTYAAYAIKWASVRPMQGTELENAQQISAVATHKIRIRYNADVKPLDRITFKTRTFEIVHVLNFQERNIYQDILAKEVVKT